MSNAGAVQPLQELLDSVLGRLSALESAAGIQSPNESGGSAAASATTEVPSGDSPAVKAYDEYITNAVIPLVDTCKELGEMEKVGGYLKEGWVGVRDIVVLASRSKMPQGDLPTTLQPHLKSVQTAIQELRKLRLSRDFDWHIKAVMEMANCLSWVLIKPPPQTPAAFCKEAIASCEFWSNKIRKQFKGKDDKQIAFCDALKAVGNELVAYITKFHLTGLTFNPKGASLSEAAATLGSTAEPAETKAPATVPPSHGGDAAGKPPGGAFSLMAELSKKQSADGSSAATGLKKVSRDQQTWRKEFKGEKSSVVPVMSKTVAPTQRGGSKKVTGRAICEFQDRGHKWVVEHQTKESANGILTIDISDPKQQVYIFNCEDITVHLKGEKKVKSIIMDKCRRVNVVFDTCISSCEMVNSEKVQCQTTGICPTFSIDKTAGCVIFLSKETLPITTFVTSQSSEMNVSYPDGDEHKEVPIPEQFVHKIGESGLSSEVSDLYH